MNAIVQKLPPEIGLRLFAMAMDYSDLPNADEIASEIRRMVGARDPDEPMTPGRGQQQEQDMRQRLEAMEVQRQQSALAVEEQRAKVRELNAKAAEIEARAQSSGNGSASGEVSRAVMEVQARAADQIDALNEQLRKLQAEVTNRTMQIKSDADMRMETALSTPTPKVRVAEIQNDNKLRRFRAWKTTWRTWAASWKKRWRPLRNQRCRNPRRRKKNPEPAQPMNLTIEVNVDAKKDEVKKSINIKTDTEGEHHRGGWCRMGVMKTLPEVMSNGL